MRVVWCGVHVIIGSPVRSLHALHGGLVGSTKRAVVGCAPGELPDYLTPLCRPTALPAGPEYKPRSGPPGGLNLHILATFYDMSLQADNGAGERLTPEGVSLDFRNVIYTVKDRRTGDSLEILKSVSGQASGSLGWGAGGPLHMCARCGEAPSRNAVGVLRPCSPPCMQ